jgi:ubiquinol-cytochrome c reductase cytochrome c1 subunit
MMKQLLAVVLFVASGAASAASGAHISMDPWPAARGQDLAALQNGARLFANYCLSCHSASHMRWNRLTDIGIDERQIKDFLIFGEQKVGDLMTVAMRPADAKGWFGQTPPDLSVIVRARTSFEYKGTDYLYTLLRGYYRDAASPTGWNNIVFPSIGMPHVLWQRQGPREVTIERVGHEVDEKTKQEQFVRTVSVYDAEGNLKVSKAPVAGHPDATTSVSVKPADAALARRYDEEVADLVAFLAFMTDPSGSSRVRIGVWAMLFLAVFTAIAWWLNGTFWKDVK